MRPTRFQPALMALALLATLSGTAIHAHPGHVETGLTSGNWLWLGLAVLALAFAVGLWQGTRAASHTNTCKKA